MDSAPNFLSCPPNCIQRRLQLAGFGSPKDYHSTGNCTLTRRSCSVSMDHRSAQAPLENSVLYLLGNETPQNPERRDKASGSSLGLRRGESSPTGLFRQAPTHNSSLRTQRAGIADCPAAEKCPDYRPHTSSNQRQSAAGCSDTS